VPKDYVFQKLRTTFIVRRRVERVLFIFFLARKKGETKIQVEKKPYNETFL